MKTVKSFAKIIIALLMALALTTLTACDVLNDFFGKGEGGDGPGPGGETTSNVTLNLDGGVLQNAFTSYTEGTATDLPTPTKDYYDFAGWYETQDKTGTSVSQIPSTATGDLTYYAKWTPKTYSITYYVNDKLTTNTPNNYTYGVGATLPVPSDTNYVFDGWYEGSMSGAKVTEISTTAHGNKTFYATSVGATFNVKFNLNGGSLAGGNTTIYTFGVGLTLPKPTHTNTDMNFVGWYTKSDLSGTKVTAITSTDTGNKEYWAKWSEKGAIEATFGGYEEGAYVELTLDKNVSLDDITVSYKSNGGSSKTLTGNDKTYLVRRISDDTVRADIVGIAQGTCEINVDVNGEKISDTVNVTNYDRSGYAHFDSSKNNMLYSSGVGGYKNDGTPKSNAVIIYVTNGTKNSVTATINKKEYTGLVNILQNLSKDTSKSYIIRIVGRIEAATWEEIKYTMTGSSLSPDQVISQTETLKKITLSKQEYSQSDLEGMGFKYDTSKYSRLNNLGGKMKYDSSKNEFDSCWNDCQISNAQNVTVEGIGTDAGLFQWGMTWKTCKSIEIRNLTFTDYTEDACSFEGSTGTTAVDSFTSQRLWLHHNTFNIGKNYWDVCKEQDKHDGDGATDFKGVSYVTIAYNRYNETHKTGLIGGGSSHMSANITFHHNYYNSCSQRLPLARQANMHMYNNYYHNSSTSLSLRSSAYAFVEYCYFDGSNNTMIEIQSYDDDEKHVNTYAVAKVYNCYMGGKGYNYDKMPTSEKPSKADINKANAPYIIFVEDNSKTGLGDRTANIASNCSFCSSSKCFDIDSTKFYYDATNKCSKVDNLITNVSSIPTEIPKVAGVRH